MSEIRLQVTGYPAPQGSKKAWVNKHTGRAQMREQGSEKIGLWRQDVKAAALHWVAKESGGVGNPGWATSTSPLRVDITFRFPRPKSHFRTGRWADQLRDNAPLYPTTRATGDTDKLCRSTLDALVTAGLFADDTQVVDLHAVKLYAEGFGRPGAVICIRSAARTCVGDVHPDVRPEEATLL